MAVMRSRDFSLGRRSTVNPSARPKASLSEQSHGNMLAEKLMQMTQAAARIRRCADDTWQQRARRNYV